MSRPITFTPPRYLYNRAVAQRCRLSNNVPISHHLVSRTHHPNRLLPSQTAALTSSTRFFKKSGKANLSHSRTDSSPPVHDAAPRTAADEAFDFSHLESSILKALERLAHALSQLRAGGRLNPEVLEKLRVALPRAGGQGQKETVRLGELAQILPKGRVISIIVGEAEHIKPISTAIRASEHSLTPQGPSPDNPVTLTIQVPPPTGESRRKALEAAHNASEVADKAIHDARAKHQKKLRAFQKERSVRPDDLQKAHLRMEEIAKKGHGEVKHIVDGAKRVLEAQ